MSFFGLFKRRDPQPGTAPVARERLQVLLTHERANSSRMNLLSEMRKDIIDAITRHVSVTPEDVKVRIERRERLSILRVAVDLPAQ